MKTINYKGKGEHSVNELELIIEQQAEELHLLKSGQKQLTLYGVVGRSEQLTDFVEYCDEEHGLFIPIPSWMIDGYNKIR